MSGFKKAFKCSQYQGFNGRPCDCPAWTSLTETNIQSGEERQKNDCVFRMLPHLMVDVIRASNRPAAALLEIRNQETRKADALDLLAKAVRAHQLRLAHDVNDGSGEGSGEVGNSQGGSAESA